MWALALLVALSPEAPAGIAVVSSVVVGSAGRMTGIEVESDLRRSIASRPSLRAERLSGALRQSIASCGASTECMARGLEEAGYALCLRVAADQRFVPAAFTAQLIDVSRARVIDEVVGEAATSDELRVALDGGVGALLDRSGHVRLARVDVDVRPLGSPLVIEPAPVAGEGGKYWVTEGQYRVRADDRSWVVQAVAGRTSSLRIDTQPPTDDAGSWWWLAVTAAVVVASAASIGVAAATAGGGDCLCLAPPGVECPACPE